VYGPSGVRLPQILVRLSREGKVVAHTQTDSSGKFEFKIKPGIYNLELLFFGSTSMNLRMWVVRGHGGPFYSSPRLRIVMGLSGTRCGFATISSKEFKQAIKRFEGQLEKR
jgi:hypothetical protein